MTTIKAMSATYAQARAGFLDAARAAGGRIEHHRHPRVGPDGEELAVDVAEFGPADSGDVVTVFSATHGVEGFCGSALQRHWLEEHAAQRPEGVCLIMVHALNPFGFAWVRRVNEDNVDLNRNFIDWSQPVPTTPEYDNIANLVVPTEWSEAEQARTFNALLEYVNDVGLDRMQAIVSGGQFSDPTGVFYGGREPVWSHRWLRSWASARLTQVDRLTIIDLHTGLGESGHGELIGSEASDSNAHQRAQHVWGDVRSMFDGDSVSAVITGDWLAVASALAPRAEIAAAALEYGTVDPITVLQALRADAWLHSHGDPAGPEAPAIRAQVRAAFADDRSEWIGQVWPRFEQVLNQAFAYHGARH